MVISRPTRTSRPGCPEGMARWKDNVGAVISYKLHITSRVVVNDFPVWIGNIDCQMRDVNCAIFSVTKRFIRRTKRDPNVGWIRAARINYSRFGTDTVLTILGSPASMLMLRTRLSALPYRKSSSGWPIIAAHRMWLSRRRAAFDARNASDVIRWLSRSRHRGAHGASRHCVQGCYAAPVRPGRIRCAEQVSSFFLSKLLPKGGRMNALCEVFHVAEGDVAVVSGTACSVCGRRGRCAAFNPAVGEHSVLCLCSACLAVVARSIGFGVNVRERVRVSQVARNPGCAVGLEAPNTLK